MLGASYRTLLMIFVVLTVLFLLSAVVLELIAND